MNEDVAFFIAFLLFVAFVWWRASRTPRTPPRPPTQPTPPAPQQKPASRVRIVTQDPASTRVERQTMVPMGRPRREAQQIVVVKQLGTCPVCLVAFTPDDRALVRCTKQPAHVVHRECRALADGRCPKDGFPLER